MQVQAPDGSVVEFPEGTPDSVMEKAMQEAYPIQHEPSKVLDVAQSLGQGMQEGVGAIVGMPTDIYNGMQSGADWLGKKAAGLVTGKETEIPRTPLPFGSSNINAALDSVTGHYEPQTTTGEYARTIGQFLPAAGKGVVNTIKNAIIPAVSSEVAGQVTKGTELEPYARLAGGLTAAGVTGLASRPQNAEKFLASRAGNVSPEDFKAAQALMDKANSMGTPISVAEALQHVTSGKTMLADTQRVLEQTQAGGPTLREFYQNRPQTNAAAAGRAFDAVAPVNMSPSGIAPAVQSAAKERIEQIRKQINEKSEPYYKTSRTDMIPDEAALAVQSNPAYQIAEKDVLSHPVLSPKIADLDSNQVGVMDSVKKRLRAFYEKTNLEKDRQLGAEYTAAEAQARDAMREASPNYATALDIQNEGRARFLEPAKAAPIGQLAETPTLEGQLKAVFNQNPIVGSQNEVAEAISRVAGINPKAAQDLVRQHLAGSFNEANQALHGGMNQFGGAGYAAKISGNTQQASNLEAAIKALPDGSAKWQQVSDLLDVFKAQGRRAPVGSATEFNKMINADMGEGTALQNVAETALSPSSWLTAAKDYGTKWRYNKVAGKAADILTDAQGANILASAKNKMPLSLSDFYKPSPYLYQLQRGGQ